MIHKVLNAYFALKQNKKMTRDIVLAILVVVLFILANIILFFLKISIIYKLVIPIVLAVGLFMFILYFEKKKSQKWKTEFNEYNKALDELSKILKTLEYQDESGCNNWYSKDKIDYLIVSAQKWVTEQNESRANLEKFARIIVLPIIGFVAAVIQNNASIADAISIGIVVILVVSTGYVIDRGLSMVIDSVIKTASIDEMSMLINLLQDLRARDFT